MRINSPAAWIACLGLSMSAVAAFGQQTPPRAGSGIHSQPSYTPITVEQRPQTLPAAPVEARLLAPERQGLASQSPYRLTAAEAPVLDAPLPTPLRLAPRNGNGRLAAAGPAEPAAASVGGTLGTVAGSLAVVLGLFFIVVWCTRRFAPSGSALLPKEAVELLGRASLTGRQQVQLLRIGNKLLLVALSPVGVETLTEITEPAEVEHLLALCRREQPGSSSAAFRQVLSQLASEPAPGGFVGTTGSSSRGGR